MKTISKLLKAFGFIASVLSISPAILAMNNQRRKEMNGQEVIDPYNPADSSPYAGIYYLLPLDHGYEMDSDYTWSKAPSQNWLNDPLNNPNNIKIPCSKSHKTTVKNHQ